MATFLAGQKLRASELNDIGITAYCTTDVTKNANTTLGDVTGMSVSLAANAQYAVDGWLYWQSNPTADIKFGWTVPSGTTGFWSIIGPRVDTAPVAGSERINHTDYGTVATSSTLSAAGDDEFTGTVFISAVPHCYFTTTNAGTLQLQFAQNTSNASNTIIKTGSWMRVTRLDA